MKPVFFFLLLVVTAFSQPFKYESNSRVEGYYTVFNGAECVLNNEGYQIFKNSKVISSVSLTGKKIFLRSREDFYFAIANFEFNIDSDEYPVTIDLFNSSFEKSSYSFNSPSGLPHPSITLTDNGRIILFDPLTFTIEVISNDQSYKYTLDKASEFEMERSFYTAADADNFYLLVSERPVNPDEDIENVFLYTADQEFTSIDKRSLPIDVPTFMSVGEGNIIASGIDFTPGGANAHTFIINGNEIQEKSFAVEKLININGGYAAKYGNSLYLLDENYEITSTRNFGGYITDIAFVDRGVAVLLNEDTWRIYNTGEKLDVEMNIALDYLDGGIPPELGFAEDTLVIYANDNTYILNEFVRRRTK
jgi:hypothetical protein